MRYPLGSVLLVSLLVPSCNLTSGRSQMKQVSKAPDQKPSNQARVITEQLAIKAAREDVEKEYGKSDQFTIIPCAQDEFWRVFFEPRNSALNTSGAEYLIDNKTGAIISKHELPLGAGTNFERSPERSAISREEAVTIARKDADNAYGSSTTLSLTVCELSSVWRIIYSPRQGLNGGGPEYVIDKTTGKILDKKYYQ